MYSNLVDCFQGFYHGPVVSKIWLCEQLEPIMDNLNFVNPNVHIIGCWQNVFAFMLQVRRPNYYTRIDGYDIDKLSIDASNRICDAWYFENSKVYNHNIDFYTLKFDYEPETVFVNCSVDQFKDRSWYDIIPNNSIVALQTTDIVTDNPPWEITQNFQNIDEFIATYPLSETLFSGIKPIEYSHFKYNRLMLIGIK